MHVAALVRSDDLSIDILPALKDADPYSVQTVA